MGVDVEILTALVGAVAAAVGASASMRILLRSRKRAESFEERVARLTHSLNEAGRVVGELEREIASRRRLVDELRQEQVRMEFSREEVDAVAQALRAQLRHQGQRTLLLSLVQGAAFFVLGVVATILIG